MMENMTNKQMLSDDELVAMFFEENKQELADDGFSHRVMEQLPTRMVRLSRIWTAVCSVLGIVFLIWVDGLALLKGLIMNAFGNIGGFLSSVDLSGTSPLLILAAMTVCAMLIGWNVVADRKMFWK